MMKISSNLAIEPEELRSFLVKAKRNAWAGNVNEVPATRPNFKRHVFKMGNWEYEDEYTGFYCAPGQEIVRYSTIPAWAMSYDGGMSEKYRGYLDFARTTFAFLKEALANVPESMPLRGHDLHKKDNLIYRCSVTGDIIRFRGNEMIRDAVIGLPLFEQNFMGGIIVHK